MMSPRIENQPAEKLIKGIPLHRFCDEIFRQKRICDLAEGDLRDFPIEVEGIGLHAIQKRRKIEEDLASGVKARNSKFVYKQDIDKHFHRDEHRFKNRETKIFEQMEDLLDDEEVR